MYTIYSKPNCAHCEQAKQLLKSKGLDYTEFVLDIGQPKETGKRYATVAQLKEKVPTAKAVPQIFVGETLVGGFEALRQSLSSKDTHGLSSTV